MRRQRRNWTRCWVAAVLLGSGFGRETAKAQNPFEPETHAACVARIQAPAYSTAARQARAEGTITVSVFLSAEASVDLITAQFKSKAQRAIGILMESVEAAVREASYRGTCGGETVVLIFDFTIAGRPSDNPKQSVSFGYPNKFWIVTEPGKPVAEGVKTK